MRLRLHRSQRSSGFLNKIIFSLEARVDLTVQERESVHRYKLGREIIYLKDRVQPAAEADQQTWKGIARNLARFATTLTIRVDDLIRGRVIECKDILEMLAVEEQLLAACTNFKAMLQSAAFFDGEEVVEI